MTDAWPTIVLGGSGYVAGEMLRLIARHPRLTLAAAVSTSQAGEPMAATFGHLAPVYSDACFVSLDATIERLGEADHWVVLSAAPHAASASVVGELLDAAEQRGVALTIVDASADFRFDDAAAFAAVYHQDHPRPDLLSRFTCAVPEHAAEIDTPHAAHPGCFATTMLLGIVPLIKAGLVEPAVAVSAITGSTGAGRSPRETTHHPVRNSNLFAYQPLIHRHAPEVRALILAAIEVDVDLDFVPHSGPFARGIHATIFARLTAGADSSDVDDALESFYRDAKFVRVAKEPPRMKDIVGSNHAILSASCRGTSVVVCSVLDNLVKGAAGGSLQWVNRLLDLPEELGLDAPAAGWV